MPISPLPQLYITEASPTVGTWPSRLTAPTKGRDPLTDTVPSTIKLSDNIENIGAGKVGMCIVSWLVKGLGMPVPIALYVSDKKGVPMHWPNVSCEKKNNNLKKLKGFTNKQKIYALIYIDKYCTTRINDSSETARQVFFLGGTHSKKSHKINKRQ